MAQFIEESDYNINVDLDPDLKITIGITMGYSTLDEIRIGLSRVACTTTHRGWQKHGITNGPHHLQYHWPRNWHHRFWPVTVAGHHLIGKASLA